MADDSCKTPRIMDHPFVGALREHGGRREHTTGRGEALLEWGQPAGRDHRVVVEEGDELRLHEARSFVPSFVAREQAVRSDEGESCAVGDPFELPTNPWRRPAVDHDDRNRGIRVLAKLRQHAFPHAVRLPGNHDDCGAWHGHPEVVRHVGGRPNVLGPSEDIESPSSGHPTLGRSDWLLDCALSAQVDSAPSKGRRASVSPAQGLDVEERRRVVGPPNVFELETTDVVLESFADETVAVHLGTGRYFSINMTGAEVLELLRSGNEVGAIAANLAARHEADPQMVDSAVADFVERLLEEGLIRSAVSGPQAALPGVPGRQSRLRPRTSPCTPTWKISCSSIPSTTSTRPVGRHAPTRQKALRAPRTLPNDCRRGRAGSDATELPTGSLLRCGERGLRACRRPGGCPGPRPDDRRRAASGSASQGTRWSRCSFLRSSTYGCPRTTATSP